MEIHLHGSGVISVRPATKDAFLALNKVLIKWNYRTRRADTGAFNCRTIAGTGRHSLHAYGLAADLNWQSNPYQKKLKTDMPAGMIAEIQSIRTNSGAQVFRWGGTFGTPDAMHYEICCSPRDIASGIRGAVSSTPVNVAPKPGTTQAPLEEDDSMFYVRRKKNGDVWRLHGNSGRHMSPAALQFDQFIAALGGKKIAISDMDEAQFAAVAKNTTNSATGKAIL